MILSIINQKGGVAKTTTTFNLAHNLAAEGYKVLQVDLDPQASLTIANGFEPNNLDQSIYNVLCEETNIEKVIHKVNENLSICVSNLDLSAAEINLVNQMARETLLNKALKKVKEKFDYILIDCPPNLGLLTVNALCASEKVIIPVATDYLSLRGLKLLVDTVGKIRDNLNENLEIIGVIATMYDSRTRHSNEILDILKADYNVIGIISDSVKVKDSILASIPLIHFDKSHKTAKEYRPTYNIPEIMHQSCLKLSNSNESID